DVRQRWVRTEPLTTCGSGRRTHFIVVRPVALHFVETANGVLCVRNEEHVVWCPPVVETVRPHPGHTALGEFKHVVLCKLPPLGNRNGVDGWIVRTRARRRVE